MSVEWVNELSCLPKMTFSLFSLHIDPENHTINLQSKTWIVITNNVFNNVIYIFKIKLRKRKSKCRQVIIIAVRWCCSLLKTIQEQIQAHNLNLSEFLRKENQSRFFNVLPIHTERGIKKKKNKRGRSRRKWDTTRRLIVWDDDHASCTMPQHEIKPNFLLRICV